MGARVGIHDVKGSLSRQLVRRDGLSGPGLPEWVEVWVVWRGVRCDMLGVLGRVGGNRRGHGYVAERGGGRGW